MQNADDWLASSKKSKGNNEGKAFSQLSTSIEKYSQSLITAAKISANEQVKNPTQQEGSTRCVIVRGPWNFA